MPVILKVVVLVALLALCSRPLVASDRASEAVFDCWEPDLVFKQCAVAGRDGEPRLKSSYLSRLRFDQHGLAAVLLLGAANAGKSRWFYVRRGGSMAPVETYDNFAEEFRSGLARSPVGGKIGYIDRNLDLVIPAKYDGAYPFENGVAKVCLACSLVSDGEHNWYEGGRWARIDHRGRTVTPFQPWETRKKEERRP